MAVLCRAVQLRCSRSVSMICTSFQLPPVSAGITILNYFPRARYFYLKVHIISKSLRLLIFLILLIIIIIIIIIIINIVIALCLDRH